MAVRTFNFNVGEQGPGDIAIAMGRCGCVTILTKEPAFGVTLAGLEFVVGIILNKLVEFGEQLGLLLPSIRVGAAVRKLHEALKGDPNTFAAIVTGDASLMRNARVDQIVHNHFGLTRGLNGVNHCMTGFVAFHRLIAALIETRIVVGNMAGGTAHTAEVAALVPAFNPYVATLAISANVSINSFPGLLFKRIDVGFGNLEQSGWEIAGIGLHKCLGVFLVLICPEYWVGAIGIVHIIVAVLFFVAR